MKSFTVGPYEIKYIDVGNGFPTLLIHGLAGDHTGWNGQIETWSNQLRLIAPDTRGAGVSTQIDEPVTIEQLADDFIALIDSLGVQKLHIVGRSMGGSIAQWIALKRPEKVQSLVLLASCGKFDHLAIRTLENMLDVLELTGSWARHAKHSVANFVSHRFFNEEAERVKKIEELIGSSNRMIACYKAQNIAVRNHDILHRLKDIDCPVLVMSGGQDPLGGPILTGWMLDRFPNVKHIEFKQSSHFFLMEEHNLFMQHMNDWFIQHTPK